jgi:hypothetical protein
MQKIFEPIRAWAPAVALALSTVAILVSLLTLRTQQERTALAGMTVQKGEPLRLIVSGTQDGELWLQNVSRVPAVAIRVYVTEFALSGLDPTFTGSASTGWLPRLVVERLEPFAMHPIKDKLLTDDWGKDCINCRSALRIQVEALHGRTFEPAPVEETLFLRGRGGRLHSSHELVEPDGGRVKWKSNKEREFFSRLAVIFRQVDAARAQHFSMLHPHAPFWNLGLERALEQ